MNKKSQLTLIIVLVLIVLALILLPISFGFTAFFLTKNLFVLVGVFLIVMGVIGFFMKWNMQIAFTLLGIGLVLIFVPFIFKNLAGITLNIFR